MEHIGRDPRPDQLNYHPDDRRDDRRHDNHRDDWHNDNHDCRNDNRDRHRQDDFRGWQTRIQPVDNAINAIKPVPKRNYEDVYSKVL
jgi:hypothetical protein